MQPMLLDPGARVVRTTQILCNGFAPKE